MSSTDSSSKIAKFKLKFRNFSYPLSPNSYWLIFGIFLPFYFPIQPGEIFIRVLGKVGVYSFILWIRLCVICRVLLTCILKHKGFILETRGSNQSTKTSIYTKILETIYKWNNPKLLRLENALPRMSVPPLEQTISKYLESIRPFTDDDNYTRLCREADDFQKDIGKKLQKKLVFKSWKSENYVMDWWEDYHYLKCRDPLMYGTSICISDNINCPTTSQSARAANLTYLMLKYREKIDSQELEPIYLRNIIPIAMSAYEKLFNTTRVPGVEADKIVHYESSTHIIVINKGRYFKVNIYYDGGRMLDAAEFQYQFKEILGTTSNATATERSLASLTTLSRAKWAFVRDKFFLNGINKVSLDAIESSAFVLVLDDEPYIYNIDSTPTEYGNYEKQLLVGNGLNRWFDKSFNLCVGNNGKAGLLGEHTWGDGNIISNFFEECVVDDYYCYDEHGIIKKDIENIPKSCEQLKWDFSDEELVNLISEASVAAEQVVENVDHKVAIHRDFSSGFMKKCQVSPDAFIQMAFQLAFYRKYKKFCLTYEPAMTRLFRKGRTETIRSCSNESSSWVKSMDDLNFNKTERLELFKASCQKHQKLYLDAMYGGGVDRHLFALQIAGQQNGIESKFLNEALSQSFRLFTTHIPHGQTPKTNHSKNKFLISSGGALPPAAHDGYGISYFPFNDDLMFLHVSSYKNCKETDSDEMLNDIFQALSDIKKLFDS